MVVPMKKNAFSLVELMIVVSILGILAAIVIPQFQDYTQQAKETAAKDNLRSFRNAIEHYANQNNDVAPGFPSNNPALVANYTDLVSQLIGDGNLLKTVPENPFTEDATFLILSSATPMPAAATGSQAWVYKPSTKELRLYNTGTDSQGVAYYDY